MIVSVPLRGYGFEMLNHLYREVRNLNVSVPLRGYGFEIKQINENTANCIVSVPLRGYGFEISPMLFGVKFSS